MTEEIVQFIQFIVFVFGLTHYLTASLIFAPLRMFIHARNLTLGYLVYCPVCASTWIGAALGALGAYPFDSLLHPIVDAALFASVFVYMFLPAEIPLDHPAHHND